MKKICYSLIAFAISLVCLLSCVTNIDVPNMSKEIGYGTALVIPVGTAHTRVDQLLDFINTDYVRQDSGLNTCYLYFSDSIIINTDSIHIADFSTGKLVYDTVDIAQKAREQGKTLPFSVTSEFDFDKTITYDYDYNHMKGSSLDQRIDSGVVKSARLYFKIDKVDMVISPSNPLTIEVNFSEIAEIPAFTETITSMPYTITKTFENFKVRFAGGKTTTPMDVTYKYHASSGTITENSQFRSEVQFQIVDATVAWGFFDRVENPVLTEDHIYQEIPSNMFSSATFKNNHLYFTDPHITFDVESNVGFPMNFNVTSITAIDEEGNKRDADFNGKKGTTIRLEKPQYFGQISHNYHTFTKDDGHTERLFEITPKSFDYKFNVSIGEFNSEWERQHYAIFPPIINMYITGEIPFQFNKKTLYQRGDTLDCDIAALTGMAGIDEALKVDTLNIKFHSINHLPCKAVAKVSMLDSLGNVLIQRDNLSIKAAPVNAQGRTTGQTESEFWLGFNNTDIRDIWEAKKAVILVSVDAKDPENEMIYFSLDDELTTHVSLFVKARIEADIDSIGTLFKK